ncbi:MAG TPA: type II secretion system protein [Terriglobales bacterium]|nr:type II secretion system protein [Terriglobales bacterium]
MRSERGFSLTEMLVVTAILLIVGSLSVPNITRAVDNIRLKGAAQQVASMYQQARIQATQDDTYHELLTGGAGGTTNQIWVDLDGDAQWDAGEPLAQMPPQVSLISQQAVPVQMNPATLGFAPLTADNSSGTYNQQGTKVKALAWNGQGLPCQRVAPGSICSNQLQAGSVAWVQYLQLQRSVNGALYAAVTVSPTGKIRIWSYTPGANGGWF